MHDDTSLIERHLQDGLKGEKSEISLVDFARAVAGVAAVAHAQASPLLPPTLSSVTRTNFDGSLNEMVLALYHKRRDAKVAWFYIRQSAMSKEELAPFEEAARFFDCTFSAQLEVGQQHIYGLTRNSTTAQ